SILLGIRLLTLLVCHAGSYLRSQESSTEHHVRPQDSRATLNTLAKSAIRSSRQARTLSGKCPLEHAPYDLRGVEVVLDQRARQPAVPDGVGHDGIQAVGGLLDGPEAEQSCRVGQDSARASVLDDGGAATGQVAEGAIAHPGALQANGRRLRAA